MAEIIQANSELLTLIRNLSNQHVPKEYGDILTATKKVKELTRSVWETKYSELLSDLEALTANTHHDIQQFWFECLSFPYPFPQKKGLKGETLSRDYYNLPTSFNDIGFHDSRVIGLQVSQDVEMTIDHIDEWKEDERGWELFGKTKKLIFQNAEILAYNYLQDRTRQQVDISLIEFPSNDILDFWEIPLIKYVQKAEALSCDYKKRGFKMESTADGYTEIFVISDGWRIESVSNDTHQINYAFKANK